LSWSHRLTVKTASGSLQGRKPDDECHRLRRGRENLQRKFIVTGHHGCPFY